MTRRPRSRPAPLFSRRHYEAIAAWYRDDGDSISALADLFEADNPRFDRDRFYAVLRGRDRDRTNNAE